MLLAVTSEASHALSAATGPFLNFTAQAAEGEGSAHLVLSAYPPCINCLSIACTLPLYALCLGYYTIPLYTLSFTLFVLCTGYLLLNEIQGVSRALTSIMELNE